MAHELVLHDESLPNTDLVLLTPQNLNLMKEQRRLFLDFVKSQMVEGVDYGRHGNASKQTLLKAGAEKLLRLFGLGFRIKQEKDTIELDPPFAMASRTIEVYSLRTEKILSECQGSQNSFEPQFRNKHPLAVLNTIQKMAQKRALVGAVLSAVGASELFTQDLDDEEPHKSPQPTTKPLTRVDIVVELGRRHQWNNEQYRRAIKHLFNKESVIELNDNEFKLFCEAVREYAYPEVIKQGKLSE